MSENTLLDQICSGYLLDKEGLVDALISAWQKDHRVGGALCKAACVPYNVRLSEAQWDAMVSAARRVLPLLPEHMQVSQPVRAFMAVTAGNAGDALWDENPDLAKKILMSGKVKAAFTKNTKPWAEARRETRKTARTTRYVRARELDKSHDWNTVK